MRSIHGWMFATSVIYWIGMALFFTGCRAGGYTPVEVPEAARAMPRELAKTVLPQYVIEPPDILAIETIHAVPKSPYFLKTLDVLAIRVAGALPDGPIGGTYPIEPGGGINLGIPYGSVRVAGMTVEQARDVVQNHLKQFLKDPDVTVALAELGAAQRVAGQYLVGPDGTVTLGSYGGVQIVGMTLPEAKAAIEQHLSNYLENPVVSLDVFAYNSKVYYIVLQGAELGDGVYRFPVTGNDTVLDALANINGMEQVSSKKIWVSRPQHGSNCLQILPVDWIAITENADSTTNYQLLPGDRVFVAEDRLVALDNRLAKVFAPFERMMGFSLLSVGTTTRFSGRVLKGGGNPAGTAAGF